MPAVQRNAVVAFTRTADNVLSPGKPQFVATGRDAVNLARETAEHKVGSIAVQFIDSDGWPECAVLLSYFGAAPPCVLTEVV